MFIPISYKHTEINQSIMSCMYIHIYWHIDLCACVCISWMYVCMYVYIHVGIYVYMCLCMSARSTGPMYLVSIYVCLDECMCVCSCVRTHVCMYFLCLPRYWYLCVCTFEHRMSDGYMQWIHTYESGRLVILSLHTKRLRYEISLHFSIFGLYLSLLLLFPSYLYWPISITMALWGVGSD